MKTTGQQWVPCPALAILQHEQSASDVREERRGVCVPTNSYCVAVSTLGDSSTRESLSCDRHCVHYLLWALQPR